jgi:hypothetical protein
VAFLLFPEVEKFLLRACGNVEIGAIAEELAKFNYHLVVSQRRFCGLVICIFVSPIVSSHSGTANTHISPLTEESGGWLPR